ncbi:hypothetical protein TNCV_4485151 [Trichonephila clavipes]|nr:hypothetical protein TNCV_4485151 [Trichonephila clavipes]
MRGGRPLTLPQDVRPQNWGGTELNRTVNCMVLKAKAMAGVHLAPCHVEFRGLRSDYVRQAVKDIIRSRKNQFDIKIRFRLGCQSVNFIHCGVHASQQNDHFIFKKNVIQINLLSE